MAIILNETFIRSVEMHERLWEDSVMAKITLTDIQREGMNNIDRQRHLCFDVIYNGQFFC